MVEELKGADAPQVAAKSSLTYAEDVAMWSEKAPKCKCGREKVIYICQD
jgi:hypothetical protein